MIVVYQVVERKEIIFKCIFILIPLRNLLCICFDKLKKKKKKTRMANVNPKVYDFRMPVHLIFTDCVRVFFNLTLVFPFFSFDVNFRS